MIEVPWADHVSRHYRGYNVLIGLPVFLSSPPMGWEVFHQTTLIPIPTPICLTELTSKRERNGNVMIKGLVDNGLHVTYELYPFVLKSYMSQSHLPCHDYELFFVPPYCHYNLISLVLTWPPVSTSSFWSRSPTRCIWAKAVCFDCRLTKKDYLQTNAFLYWVVVERGEYHHALQKKATGGRATSKVVRKTAGWTRLSLTLGMSTSAPTIYHTTQWIGMTAE